jgi:hypothetical protein
MPDKNGDRLCSDAQHTSVKRALASLRRKGLVIGQQDVEVVGGKRIFQYVTPGTRYAERCCLWSAASK